MEQSTAERSMRRGLNLKYALKLVEPRRSESTDYKSVELADASLCEGVGLCNVLGPSQVSLRCCLLFSTPYNIISPQTSPFTSASVSVVDGTSIIYTFISLSIDYFLFLCMFLNSIMYSFLWYSVVQA